MNKKSLSIVFSFAIAGLILASFGCSKGVQDAKDTEQAAPATTPAPASTPAPGPAPMTSHPSVPAAPAAATAAGTAGVEWTIPQGWTAQPDRPMRLATYSIPAAGGDSEGAECAVFYFGTGQGGNVRANIDRWIGQFKTESKPQESSRTVNGVQVTTVIVDGTYLAPGGPMMQSQGEKPGYRLLGTIVEAPEGPVFFKTTGPKATVEAAEKDVTALVDSIRKSS